MAQSLCGMMYCNISMTDIRTDEKGRLLLWRPANTFFTKWIQFIYWLHILIQTRSFVNCSVWKTSSSQFLPSKIAAQAPGMPASTWSLKKQQQKHVANRKLTDVYNYVDFPLCLSTINSIASTSIWKVCKTTYDFDQPLPPAVWNSYELQHVPDQHPLCGCFYAFSRVIICFQWWVNYHGTVFASMNNQEFCGFISRITHNALDPKILEVGGCWWIWERRLEKKLLAMSVFSDFSFASSSKLNCDPSVNWQKHIWKLMRKSRGCLMKQTMSWNWTHKCCVVMLLATFCFTKYVLLCKKKVIFIQVYMKTLLIHT